MVSWESIDTVLLDMDGTLLDLRFDNRFWMDHLPEMYARQNGMELEKAKDRLFQAFTEKQGTLDWYCIDYWSERLQMDIPLLKQDLKHLIGPRPHAMEFLQALGESGKRRVLVTNAHPDSIEIKMLNSDLGNDLDRVLTSHDFGFPKEEQAFWQALRETEPFELANTLFIDDSKAVLESAHRFGIGFIRGILRPDSQGESRAGEHEFPMIDSFLDILPG